MRPKVNPAITITMPTATANTKHHQHHIFNTLTTFLSTRSIKHHSDNTTISSRSSSEDMGKYSDTRSIGSRRSTGSMSRKLLFNWLRKVPSTISSPEQEAITSTAEDYSEEKLLTFYNFAEDELKYAEDSVGSIYYALDREALDEAFEKLAEYIKEHNNDVPKDFELNSSSKTSQLKERINSLPDLESELDSDSQ